MMRHWIAVALLAGSWLFGLDYYFPACPWTWLAVVLTGVALLGDVANIPLANSQHNCKLAAIVLLLPVVWCAAWPYRAAPLLILLGLAVQLAPIKRRWIDWLAEGAVTAGVVMWVQALVLEVYAARTAYSHELPWPLPEMLSGIAGLLGMEAAADGSNVVLHSMRQVHRLGATWELLVDPATLLLLVGGMTMLALRCYYLRGTASNLNLEISDAENVPPTVENYPRWSAWIRACRALAIVVACWLPVRAGLMMAVYLHRVLRSDPERPLHAMNHLFSPWMLLVLLVVPVLLAWRFVRIPRIAPQRDCEPLAADQVDCVPVCCCGKLALPVVLCALSVALFTAAIHWDPVGVRQQGRVKVVERHSTWEPTTRPYDTTWFGEPSGYNYAAIYDYLGQYYQMSRLLETDAIDEATLADCDVLIIKTPTARYSPAEVNAVVQFVERGGGLMVIGDHTNFERSTTIINDITRPMGFILRDDLLFSFNESPYDQLYVAPWPAHPVVQHLPPMDFAVSCSVDPGSSRGRAVIRSTGLWSMGPEYHHENFHPIPQHCPEMRYGAFVQVWSTRHKRGRAVAFTDSTIFSNFCVFQPGKAELMLGMVEWLNHRPPPLDSRPWLILLGLVVAVGGMWQTARLWPSSPATQGSEQKRQNVSQIAWLVLLAAGGCGWSIASAAVAGLHHWAMPLPECHSPQRCVVIDREISATPLSKGAYPTGDEGEGYGLFEQWIPRTGCYTIRKTGTDVFSGDALVFFAPSRSVPDQFREQLAGYVFRGGKLLVVDSPENTGSTANSLLWPFGLAIHHDRAWKGKLSTTDQLPVLEVASANQVVGGTPLAKLGNLPVVAKAKYGDGLVMAVGCGSLWNDKNMGETWLMEPDATVKSRYEVLFALLRCLLDDEPLPNQPARGDSADRPALPESGPADL